MQISWDNSTNKQNVLELGETIYGDGTVCMDLHDGKDWACADITEVEAKQIVDHLTKVFNL